MKKVFVLLISLLCILLIPVELVLADTDGTEQQVAQPEILELQLGPEWAGVEFQLKTDAGIYPGTITVDENGVLRTELGGSKSYVLSCMESSVSLPVPDSSFQASDTNTNDTSDIIAVEGVESSELAEEDIEKIPIVHIVVFIVGLLLAIGCLVVLHSIKQNKLNSINNDEEDEE